MYILQNAEDLEAVNLALAQGGVTEIRAVETTEYRDSTRYVRAFRGDTPVTFKLSIDVEDPDAEWLVEEFSGH